MCIRDRLNALYVDYKIDTKSEVTPAEQVAINLKKTEVENIEDIINDGGTTLAEVNSKKKTLDDAIENSTKENAAWQAATDVIENYYQQIDLLKDLTNPKTNAKSQETRDEEIKNYEDLIEE